MAILPKLALLIALFFTPKGECERASVCTCVVVSHDNPLPIEMIVQGALESSDAVFTGRVIEGRIVKSAYLRSADNYVPYEYVEFTFSVAEQWKGAEASAIKVRTGLGGGDCGFAFKIGYRYVVYARENVVDSEDTELYTGICDRTAKAGNEDLRILRQLTGN